MIFCQDICSVLLPFICSEVDIKTQIQTAAISKQFKNTLKKSNFQYNIFSLFLKVRKTFLKTELAGAVDRIKNLRDLEVYRFSNFGHSGGPVDNDLWCGVIHRLLELLACIKSLRYKNSICTGILKMIKRPQTIQLRVKKSSHVSTFSCFLGCSFTDLLPMWARAFRDNISLFDVEAGVNILQEIIGRTMIIVASAIPHHSLLHTFRLRSLFEKLEISDFGTSQSYYREKLLIIDAVVNMGVKHFGLNEYDFATSAFYFLANNMCNKLLYDDILVHIYNKYLAYKGISIKMLIAAKKPLHELFCLLHNNNNVKFHNDGLTDNEVIIFMINLFESFQCYEVARKQKIFNEFLDRDKCCEFTKRIIMYSEIEHITYNKFYNDWLYEKFCRNKKYQYALIFRFCYLLYHGNIERAIQMKKTYGMMWKYYYVSDCAKQFGANVCQLVANIFKQEYVKTGPARLPIVKPEASKKWKLDSITNKYNNCDSFWGIHDGDLIVSLIRVKN